jgi:Rad3-related DNA helicase
LGRDCPSFDDCFIVKARKKAMDSDLIVINHHLFFADLAVKETGFAELIPNAAVYIFDEAHQLPDIACEYFGESLSTRQLRALTIKQSSKLGQSRPKQLSLVLVIAGIIKASSGIDCISLISPFFVEIAQFFIFTSSICKDLSLYLLSSINLFKRSLHK